MNASQNVEKMIEEKILSGEWDAGIKLPAEGAMVKEFGVSRTAVREALRELRGRGLVETVNGSGSFVTGANLGQLTSSFKVYSVLLNDPKEVSDLLQLRSAVEGEAAASLAVNKGDKRMDAVLQVLEDMKIAEDKEQFAQLDLQFHVEVLRASRNELFILLGNALKERNLRYMGSVFHEAPDSWAVTLEEHHAVVDAILNGDAEGARKKMQQHIRNAQQRWKGDI